MSALNDLMTRLIGANWKTTLTNFVSALLGLATVLSLVDGNKTAATIAACLTCAARILAGMVAADAKPGTKARMGQSMPATMFALAIVGVVAAAFIMLTCTGCALPASMQKGTLGNGKLDAADLGPMRDLIAQGAQIAGYSAAAAVIRGDTGEQIPAGYSRTNRYTAVTIAGDTVELDQAKPVTVDVWLYKQTTLPLGAGAKSPLLIPPPPGTQTGTNAPASTNPAGGPSATNDLGAEFLRAIGSGQ